MRVLHSRPTRPSLIAGAALVPMLAMASTVWQREPLVSHAARCLCACYVHVHMHRTAHTALVLFSLHSLADLLGASEDTANHGGAIPAPPSPGARSQRAPAKAPTSPHRLEIKHRAPRRRPCVSYGILELPVDAFHDVFGLLRGNLAIRKLHFV